MGSFDPNGVGVKGSLFGLPYAIDDADIVVLPVPWDVTVSYAAGTAKGPEAILAASSQIDYFLLNQPNTWQTKIAMADIPEVWETLAVALRLKAEKYISWLEEGSPETERVNMSGLLKEINRETTQLMDYVRQETAYYRNEGKKTILLGGDHSTPYGHMLDVISREEEPVGILQIDAHADLRVAYEGFKYSHASIMWNVLDELDQVKLVQLGIRDLCESEAEMIQKDERITCFYNQRIQERLFNGEYWSILCKEVINSLPKKVYISVDIDGLEPQYCPNTGTPVPGGLSYDQLVFLFHELKQVGKEVIGADLVEVGAEEWDANVGARVLWQLVHLL